MGIPLGYLTDSIAFFDFSNIQFIPFAKESLSAEAHVDLTNDGIPPISMVHQVDSRLTVDAFGERALSSRASLTRPLPETCYGGYSSSYSDPRRIPGGSCLGSEF